jgi:two-component system heavy metal sensor histidine kinase CusS
VISRSLAARLTALFACISLLAMGAIGFALYKGLQSQLVQRDDIALISRVEQIRVLLQDSNTLDMIHQKPRLFENMLGNTEGVLILRFPGQKPLIDINPSKVPIPPFGASPPSEALSLEAVRHLANDTGIPFSAVRALAQTADMAVPIEITAGRLMVERTRLLSLYSLMILAAVAASALLLSVSAYGLLRRGLRPLEQLAQHADTIGISNLAARINNVQAPLEIAPLIVAINKMLDRLEKGFAQLSQVSTDMAHDLRTPINNLLGTTQVTLSQRRTAERYEAVLGSNAEELERLASMVDKMLFLARTDHRNAVGDKQKLQIPDEFERILDYFEGLASERSIDIISSGEGEVWADPLLLRRALANLVSNAIKYSTEGRNIRLHMNREIHFSVISVENEGPTIPEADLDKLFDRFYRADPSRKESSNSNGLGLSIVKNIMDLHGGTCDVTSVHGITTFRLRFPHMET